MKPHRNKYWLFHEPDDPDIFNQAVLSVCESYREARRLWDEVGLHTVCIDEQTGIQALERIAPGLPARPGLIARREYEYARHGTTCLFGNFEVVSGKILAPMLRATRTEKDFLANVRNLVTTDPRGRWRLIADNLNTHVSESLVRYVAQQCGIEADLGVKGRRGILRSMASRRKFLGDRSHRIHFCYTPKHCSWLNQVEIWFGVLRKKVTRYGSFNSVSELKDRIIDFIGYYNKHLAHPYRWTCDGKLLCK